MKEILFSERQRFKQWWLWLILLVLNAVFIIGTYRQVINKHSFGDKAVSDTGLLVITSFVILLTILVYNFQLETQIKQDGIYVRFFPFHFSFRHYGWDQINKSFLRRYNAISEYGGWGLRLGIFGRGRAFNVSGNKGLQLEFNDTRKLLIGTLKSEELATTLDRLGHLVS